MNITNENQIPKMEKNTHLMTWAANFEAKLYKKRTLMNVMEVFQNHKAKRESRTIEYDKNNEGVKKSLIETLYLNGNKQDNNILIVGDNLVELSYIQKNLSIDVVEHFLKTIQFQNINFLSFINEMNDKLEKDFGYKLANHIANAKLTKGYRPDDYKSKIDNYELLFNADYWKKNFDILKYKLESISIDDVLKIFEKMMKDIDSIPIENARIEMKKRFEEGFKIFFKRQYEFFRIMFSKYMIEKEPNYTNFNFSQNDLENNKYLQKNPHFKKLIDYLIFEKDEKLPYVKDFKVDNFYSSYNVYLIENVNETEKLLDEVTKKLSSYKIDHLVILDKERLKKLDLQKITIFCKENKLNLIIDGMIINYAILKEEEVLLNGVKKEFDIKKDNSLVKNYYTIENSSKTYDTINIRDIQIFNYVKELFYSNINLKNSQNIIGYLDDKNNGVINQTILNMYNKYLGDFEPHFAEKKRNSMNIHLNVIDLQISDKSMIEGFKTLKRNFSNRDVFFNKDEFENHDLLWFLFHKREYDFSQYDEFIGNEKLIPQKKLLNILLKNYRQDIPFFKTKEGSKINNIENYTNINSKLYSLENRLNTYFVELTSLLITKNSFQFAKGDKFPGLATHNLLVDEDKMVEKIANNVRILFYDYALKHLSLFNTNNVSNSALIKSALQNITHFITESFDDYLEFWLEDTYPKKIGYNNAAQEKEKGYNKYAIMNKFFPNVKIKKDLKIKDEIDYFEFMEKHIHKTMNFTRQWLQINYEMNNMFSMQKVIEDFEKILNNENVFNLRKDQFEQLKEDVKEIMKDEDFQKLKEYSSYRLFSKKDVFEFGNKKFEELDIPFTRLNDEYFVNDVSKDLMELVPVLEISPERRKEIFKKETNITQYYNSNPEVVNKLSPLQHEVMATKNSSEFYQPIIDNLNEEQLKIYNLIKSKKVQPIPSEDSNLNFLYYYKSIFKDIEEKMLDKTLGMQQRSVFVDKAVEGLMKNRRDAEALESHYFLLKGELSSYINERELIFKQDEIKILNLFSKRYIPKLTTIQGSDRENFKNIVEYILSAFDENAGEDLHIENMMRAYTDASHDFQSIPTQHLQYCYILRIFINNIKSLMHDPVLSLMHNYELIDLLLDPEVFSNFTQQALKSNAETLSRFDAIEKMVKSLIGPDIELLAYKKELDNSFYTVMSDTQTNMMKLGKENYISLLNRTNAHSEGMFKLVSSLFEKKVVEEIDLNANVKNPLFPIVLEETSPLIKDLLIKISIKYDISIIICKEKTELDKNNRSIKVFDAIHLLNNADGYNEEGKIEYNLVNRYTNFDRIDYDEDVIKINNNSKPKESESGSSVPKEIVFK